MKASHYNNYYSLLLIFLNKPGQLLYNNTKIEYDRVKRMVDIVVDVVDIVDIVNIVDIEEDIEYGYR